MNPPKGYSHAYTIEQLRAFRERDKALNDALVSAQQLRAEIREQADREAQLLMREARAQVEKDVEGIRAEARRLEDEIQGLVRARRTYLSQLRTMVERQLAEIETAEATPLPVPPMGSGGGSPPRRDEGRRDEPKQTAHPTPAWLDSLVKE